MQANIWDKCEMNNTGVEDSKHQVLEKSRVYHKNSKGKIVAAEQTDLSDRIPGGGVYSTVEDLLKFGDAVISNELIKESTFSEMISNPNLKAEGNGYGMGWYLYGENPNYGNVIGHNGSQTGASTFLMLLPEVKTTIIVLSNTSGAMQAISTITVKLFDIAHNARK
jgi:CubicO group peptidase (beta-lactamase class C family)